MKWFSRVLALETLLFVVIPAHPQGSAPPSAPPQDCVSRVDLAADKRQNINDAVTLAEALEDNRRLRSSPNASFTFTHLFETYTRVGRSGAPVAAGYLFHRIQIIYDVGGACRHRAPTNRYPPMLLTPVPGSRRLPESVSANSRGFAYPSRRFHLL